MKLGDVMNKIVETGIKIGTKLDNDLKPPISDLIKGKELEIVGIKITYIGTGENDPQMALEYKGSKYMEDEDDNTNHEEGDDK